MKKAEEIIDDIQKQYSMGAYEYLDIKDCIKAMQQYATQEVKKHLKLAANEASKPYLDSGLSNTADRAVKSITNIKIELT